MKATMLSWTAKFGLSAGHRRVLGYHVVPADRSMSVYARDSLAPALRELDRVHKRPVALVVHIDLFSAECRSLLHDSWRSGAPPLCMFSTLACWARIASGMSEIDSVDEILAATKWAVLAT
eukprot:1389613-Amphidinium_carterae.2